MLGVSEAATWVPRRVALPEAFSLLLYTDGVIEGRATALATERFGEQRLVDVLIHSQAKGRELLREILLANRSAHGGPLPDDAALLLLEHQPSVNPTKSRVRAISHTGT
jgi:serine phosphatase RsbU (regulator of sigma subunit)